MRWSSALSLACLLAIGVLSGCKSLPGYPKPQWQPPQDQLSFNVLYKQNCAACHGEEGHNGPAMQLSNPTFLAIADDATLHDIISNGMPGTMMPAFAKSAGGMLTGKQVDALVSGMRKAWGVPNILGADKAPAWLQPATGGNAQLGQKDYVMYCLSCHNSTRTNITNTSYLALVSDQVLRSIIIAGRPDLGQPDWRNVKAGHPLTDQEVTDIVTYLGSLRINNPGQPYPSNQ